MAKIKSKQVEASFTGSYVFSGSMTITGSLNVSGNIAGLDLTADSSSFASRITENDAEISSLQSATSSYALSANISGAFTENSASFSTRITTNTTNISSNDAEILDLQSQTGSYAITGSNVTFNNISASYGHFEDDVTVEGNIYAKEIHTTYISSSIIYPSGSTKFGDSQDDIHSFTGSIRVSGSIQGMLSSSAQISTDISGAFVADSSSFSTRITENDSEIISLQNVTSSYALSASISGAFATDSASFSTRITENDAEILDLQSETGSYVLNSQTSSMIVESASYAETASFLSGLVESASYANTASFLAGFIESASYAATASYVSNLIGVLSSSSQIATEISGAFTADSSSFSTRTTTLESASSSFASDIINLESASSSFASDIINLESASSSFAADIITNTSNISANDVEILSLQNATSSYALSASISGAFASDSASFSIRITENDAEILNLQQMTGSYATTGSNTFNGNQTITGSLFVSRSVELHSIDFTDGNAPIYKSGRMFYDDDDKTVAIYSDVHSGSLQIGQETWMKIVNKTGGTITNGTAVYINGVQGNRPTVAPTDTNVHSSSLLIGALTHDVANNLEGYVTTYGLVRDLNTEDYTEGDILYLSGSNGGFTSSMLPAPQHSNKVGYVISSHATQGIILVAPQVGDEITDLHDVATSVNDADGNLIVWDNTNTLWSGSNTRGLNLTETELKYTGSFKVDGTIDNVISSSAQLGDDISGSFNATSSSLASRIVSNDTDISNLQTDSGSFSTRITENDAEILNIQQATSSYVLNSQTSSMTVESASYAISSSYVGDIGVDQMESEVSEMFGILDGMAFDKPDLYLVSSSGLFFEMEKQGGGDVRFYLNDVVATLDCTTGAGINGRAQVELISGSDANNPIVNYLYASGSPSATLYTSTSLPTNDFAWISKVSVPDPVSFAASGSGVPLLQRFTEAFVNGQRGALSHEREKLRALGAVYISGGTQTLTITDATPDSVHLEVASAAVYQLHRQTFPAYTTGPYYYGNGLNQYEQIADLNEALNWQDGTAIGNNRRYNLIIWGAVNYSTNECKLFVNLPTSDYGSDSEAAADVANSADYSVPNDMRSVAFLIARVVLKYTTLAGGTFTAVEDGVYSLLGTPPGVRSGGAGAVAATEFGDTTFRVYDGTDATKELAFEVATVTTGNTRTLSIPDKNGTIALLEGDSLLSSSAQIATEISGAFASDSASFATDINNLQTDSGSFSTRITNNTTNISANDTEISSLQSATSSYALSANISGAFTEDSASFSTRITNNTTNILSNDAEILNLQSQTSSYAITGSNVTFGNISASYGHFEDDVTVEGNIYAKEVHATYTSASIIFSSGSTKFGDTQDDTHQFTGSLRISGSILGMLSSSAQISTEISGAFTTDSASFSTRITQNDAEILSLQTATSSYALDANISGAFASDSASFASDILTNASNISANDAEILSLQNATSSYALSASISGAFTVDSASFSTRTTTLESASSSFASDIITNTSNISANDTEILSLQNATSSYALSASISGAFTTDSSSLASRITSNDSDITTLQSASSSFASNIIVLQSASSSFASDIINLQSDSGSFSTRITQNDAEILNLQSVTSSYALESNISGAFASDSASFASHLVNTSNPHSIEWSDVSAGHTDGLHSTFTVASASHSERAELVLTAAQPNITSLGTLTTLTVDNVIINGTSIGHTSDTDLITLTSGNISLAGDVDFNANYAGFTQQTVSYNVTTTTVDWSAGNKASLTMTGNVGTMAFSNPPTVGNCLLKLIHSGGGRTVTTWDSDIKWANGGTAPTLSAGSGDIDIVSFYWDGTNYYGTFSGDFA